MNKLRRRLQPSLVAIAPLIGIILGLIGGPVYILIIWAVVGLAIGIFSSSSKSALFNGGAYGFLMAFVFMISGYDGTESLMSRLLPFAALGILGAVCGLILSVVGYLVSTRTLRNDS